MDYVYALASFMAVCWFAVAAARAALGKFELSSKHWWDRALLAALCANVVLANVKPVAEALHKILGGN